jgi:hypothetical protein
VKAKQHFTHVVLAFLLCTFATAEATSGRGPGGPILVITNGTPNFGKFYAEILRAEGLNAFEVVEVAQVTPTLLASHDVVILARMAVTSAQARMLAEWAYDGGNLVLMDPEPELAALAGVTPTSGLLSNAYFSVDTSTDIGSAFVAEPIQFHGTARLAMHADATALAMLHSNAGGATGHPALTLRDVGSNGGQVAAFMFDVATSIVYMRQGNPAWATDERDGHAPRRPNDMFFGNAAKDPQPDWVDLDKVAIPQADELQRLLATLVTALNADRLPLPRFWYLPHGHRAALLMTGDDHGYFSRAGGQTRARFEQFLDASPRGCSVENWECVRGTSYIFTNSALTDAAAAALEAQGFEIALHVASLAGHDCVDFTPDSLRRIYSDQTRAFHAKFQSLPPLRTIRHHCIVWSDWASAAKEQLAHGIRLDTSYYYWPPEWVRDTPGHFTGSALPMRYADLDGSIIDVYQVVTQMTDESGQSYPFTIDTLLDRALGPEEQYGVYTINAHIDQAKTIEATAAVASAQKRGVPIVSARQLLTWLDGRNSSSFTNLDLRGDTVIFGITKGPGATGLQAMLPTRSGDRVIDTLQRDGVPVSYELRAVKGVEYAMFTAHEGDYSATYLPRGQ